MKSSFAWRYANARQGKFQFQLRQDKRVTGQNGKEIPIKPGDEDGDHTIPFVIKVGDEGIIPHFPQFYADFERKIADVYGCLELTCVDAANYLHRFRYDFVMHVELEAATSSEITPATVYIQVSENERDRVPRLEPTPISPTPVEHLPPRDLHTR